MWVFRLEIGFEQSVVKDSNHHNLENDLRVKEIKSCLKSDCEICNKKIEAGTRRRNFCSNECFAIYEHVRPRVKLTENQRNLVIEKARKLYLEFPELCSFCGFVDLDKIKLLDHIKNCNYK